MAAPRITSLSSGSPPGDNIVDLGATLAATKPTLGSNFVTATITSRTNDRANPRISNRLPACRLLSLLSIGSRPVKIPLSPPHPNSPHHCAIELIVLMSYLNLRSAIPIDTITPHIHFQCGIIESVPQGEFVTVCTGENRPKGLKPGNAIMEHNLTPYEKRLWKELDRIPYQNLPHTAHCN